MLRVVLGLAALAVVAVHADEGDEGDDGSVGGGGGVRPCKHTAHDGTVFNVGPLFRSDTDFSDTTPGGFTYQFNVCGVTNKVCNRQPAPASKWRGGKCNNLGDIETQKLEDLDTSNPAAGVAIKYNEGDICKKQQGGQTLIETRQVTYEVHCDASKDPGVLKVRDAITCRAARAAPRRVAPRQPRRTLPPTRAAPRHPLTARCCALLHACSSG